MLTHSLPYGTACWVYGCQEYSFENLQISKITTRGEVCYHRLPLGQSYEDFYRKGGLKLG